MTRYHLKRQDKLLSDEAEIRAILKRGRYVTMALCRHDEPYIVTMNYGYDETGNALYFHCALEGQKLDFIEANSNVCASIIEDLGYGYRDCEHYYRSLIIRGKIYIIENLEEKKRALQVLIEHHEEKPDEAKARFLKDDKSYDKCHTLRLEIEEITAKQGLKKTADG